MVAALALAGSGECITSHNASYVNSSVSASMTVRFVVLGLALAYGFQAWAQHQGHGGREAPVVQPSASGTHTNSRPAMPMHGRMGPIAEGAMHASMPMSGLLGAYPMSRESSGTSWQPQSTPMGGKAFASGPWHLMTHGYVDWVYSDGDGPRGSSEAFTESMFMLMAQRGVGNGSLGLRAMVSLDPLTMGRDGYPLLFQTGETANGFVPLIDRQHPHDLFMELSASYAIELGNSASAFVYAGLPGEPALGPPTFMHRFSGVDDPEAPLGHHWLDATHISFGVLTGGVAWHGVKLDASVFNGREPDEHRYDIELRGLDSWSARVSWNPSPDWALQVSHGALHQPEQLEPGVDIDRTTASIMQHRATPSGQWQTTLAWGLNRKHPGRSTHAFLLESALVLHGKWTLFGRAEKVEKDELFLDGDPLHGRTFDVGKLSAGAIYDFPASPSGRFGIGAQVSRHFLPAALEPAYGNHPDSWLVFARWKLE